MTFSNEHRFNEWIDAKPQKANLAQEMADFVESKFVNSENLDAAFQAMFEEYYESTSWQSFDTACAILYTCWFYGSQLEEFRNTKFVPAS